MSAGVTAYLCVQGWADGAAGADVGSISAVGGTVTVTNADAAASKNLGDYTELALGSGQSTAQFSFPLSFTPNSSTLDGDYTLALVGVRVTPLSKDTVIRAKLTVGSVDYFSAATIYGQDMLRTLPTGTDGHELFGSGVANIVFHDLPATVFTSDVQIDLTFDEGDLDGLAIYIGSIFVGLQIPLNMNPKNFTFSTSVANDRFTTRGGNDISSSGTLLRTMSMEVNRMPVSVVTGIESGYYDGNVMGANMLRAAMASIGQPMLLSPWPYVVQDASWSASWDDNEVLQRNMSRNQNFFATYGLLDRQIDITADEYQNDLDSLYKARLRFGEIR